MLNEIKKDAQTRMAKSIDALKHELSSLRTGRASTGLVDNLKVNYYGTDTPLSQVATIAIADARSITITPWEKSMVGAVEKAILASNLGFTPNTLGQVIRINLPPLTEERRKDYIKVAKTKAEDSKISMRNIRRTAKELMEKLEKDGEIGKDDLSRGEKELEKITADHVAKIDELLKHKEAELLEV